jgi:signal transduction histidine kinase
VPQTRLFRTSSFRLAAIYLALFTVSVLILGAVVYAVVHTQIATEIDQDIEGESAALMREYSAHGGRDRLQALIATRSGAAGSFAYGLVDADGRLIGGEIAAPPGSTGFTYLREPEADEPNNKASVEVRALVTRLDGGGALVVADEWRGARGPTHALLSAFAWALVATLVLGTIGGVLLSSQALKRIEAMRSAAQAIVAGDWRRRIPETGADDELDHLARTFNLMFDRIESLLEAHKAVGAAVAHDLRRPLTRMAQRLETQLGREANRPETAAVLEAAIADIHAVLATFNAVLRIGQIESGARRAGFREVDLAAVARDIVEAFQPAAEEEGKSLTAELDDALPLSGDRELLTQMVANLVDNALRHTPSATHIVVASARRGGGGRLTVSDDGPGAPEAERRRIFERFYRLDAARSTPGDGLGLSVVAAIAELHGMAYAAEDNAPGLRIVVDLQN